MYKCIELVHHNYSGRQSAITENHLVDATLSQSMISSVHVDGAVLTLGHPSRVGQASILKLLVNRKFLAKCASHHNTSYLHRTLAEKMLRFSVRILEVT